MVKFEKFEEIAQKVAIFSGAYNQNAHFIFIFIVLTLQNFLDFVSIQSNSTILYIFSLVKNLS